MLINGLPTGTPRINANTPPPGAAEAAATTSTDGYAGACIEKAPGRPEEIAAPSAAPELSGVQKTVLASALAVSAMTGMASTAGAQTAVATQTISVALQNADAADLKFHVLPDGTPRIDLIRDTTEGANGDTWKEDYSQVGVSVGHGVFQDARGNVSLVPSMAAGWDMDAHDFQRVDMGTKGKEKVERFGNTVQFSESSTKRLIYTEKDNKMEFAGPGGKTVFEKNDDGSVHVIGPKVEYTVKQDGLYTRIDRPGQPEISIVKTGDGLRVLQGDKLTGIASFTDGQMTVKSQDGTAVVTRSQNGAITEVKGSHGMKSAQIIHDGTTFLGKSDSDKMTIDDPAQLDAAKARYDSVMAQLNAVEPNFEAKHPVVADVLKYASANPRLLAPDGSSVGFMQGGTLLASVGAGTETVSALGNAATAMNLANSARALGAAALAAQAGAQAAAQAGNLAQAGQLAQEAQGLATKAHAAQNSAIKTGGKALKEANVARVLAGAGGALEIVDGIVNIHSGKVDRSLVKGAIAVTRASMDRLTSNLQGADKAEAQDDYGKVMKVMGELDKQADKKVHVGALKIGVGGLMIVSALLGPEAPPILGAIGIAGSVGTTVYEHWGPIKSFLTGTSEHVPTFLDILPQEDHVVIHLEGVPKHK